jgi:hypothetical protein
MIDPTAKSQNRLIDNRRKLEDGVGAVLARAGP